MKPAYAPCVQKPDNKRRRAHGAVLFYRSISYRRDRENRKVSPVF